LVDLKFEFVGVSDSRALAPASTVTRLPGTFEIPSPFASAALFQVVRRLAFAQLWTTCNQPFPDTRTIQNFSNARLRPLPGAERCRSLPSFRNLYEPNALILVHQGLHKPFILQRSQVPGVACAAKGGT
jgi:hypothetical protein